MPGAGAGAGAGVVDAFGSLFSCTRTPSKLLLFLSVAICESDRLCL